MNRSVTKRKGKPPEGGGWWLVESNDNVVGFEEIGALVAKKLDDHTTELNKAAICAKVRLIARNDDEASAACVFGAVDGHLVKLFKIVASFNHGFVLWGAGPRLGFSRKCATPQRACR